MNENIIKEKIEKAVDIICPLYRTNLINQAFIVGSVAKGTARKESDIDIIIVNPPQLYIDAYSDLSRAIYPGIDRKKVENIKKEMDKIEMNLNRAKIGKGIRLLIYNKLNNKFLVELLKKQRTPELFEEGSFLEDINTTILTVYPSDIDIKKVEKYMKETEDVVKYLKDDDKWLAYNLLGMMYFNDFIKNFAKFYPK